MIINLIKYTSHINTQLISDSGEPPLSKNGIKFDSGEPPLSEIVVKFDSGEPSLSKNNIKFDSGELPLSEIVVKFDSGIIFLFIGLEQSLRSQHTKPNQTWFPTDRWYWLR